jgi:hypothetical protein
MSVDVPSNFPAVCDSVVLVPITALKTYERPDTDGISKITQSMANTGLLLDPIVIDRQRNLLIDGHHRCAALSQLGIDYVAGFSTDYFSSYVEVRGWVRISDVPLVEMERAFSLDTEELGTWQVVAVGNDEQTIATRRFLHASQATAFVQWLSERLEAGGWRVELEAPGTPTRANSNTSIRFFVTPVIGKSEVWSAIQSEVHFPNEVNRHLIHGRPLGLGIPLEQLRDQAGLTLWLQKRLGSPEQTVIQSGGTTMNGRFYEETIVIPAKTL